MIPDPAIVTKDPNLILFSEFVINLVLTFTVVFGKPSVSKLSTILLILLSYTTTNVLSLLILSDGLLIISYSILSTTAFIFGTVSSSMMESPEL